MGFGNPIASFDPHSKEALSRIKPRICIPIRHGKEASCSCFSEDGSWLAVSNNHGTIEVYKVEDGELAFTLNRSFSSDRCPCTSICFRPTSGMYSTKNVLLSGDVGGQIHHWHATSSKHLNTVKEPGNEVYSVMYQSHGQKFATAGLDAKIRIYDGVMRELCQVLSEGCGDSTAGHKNRVFSVKWNPSDNQVLLTGGWDRTVQIWDLRIGKSVRRIFGPKLCGDALDISENKELVLTGSWRTSEQLQEWDYGSGKLLATFVWPQGSTTEKTCELYSAIYGTGISQKFVAAGGSGSNEACFFHNETKQFLGGLQQLEKAVVSISCSSKGDLFVVTTTNKVFILDMQELLC